VGASSITPASSSGSGWVWNWDWSCGSGAQSPPDLGACFGCNISISVRVLSPGDDAALTQSTGATTTSVADEISSTMQDALAAVPVPVPPSPPPVLSTLPSQAIPAIPAIPAVPSVPTEVTGVPVDPAAAAAVALVGASTPADAEPTGPENAVQPAGAAGVEPAPAAAVEPEVASADSSLAGPVFSVAVPRAPSIARPAPAAARPGTTVAAPSMLQVGIARPAVHLAAVPARGPVAAHRSWGGEPADGTVPSAGFPAPRGDDRLGDAAAASPRPASKLRQVEQPDAPPVPLFPEQGSTLAAGAAGHGSGSPGGVMMGLLAAFLFIAPGLTQWLRVGTVRRPRLLRAGRRERPG
jgi:hypothetical protein